MERSHFATRFLNPFVPGLLLVFALVPAHDAAAVDYFADVFDGHPTYFESRVELQGGVPQYEFDELMDIKEALEEAIKLVVYSHRPGKKNIFLRDADAASARPPTENS